MLFLLYIIVQAVTGNVARIGIHTIVLVLLNETIEKQKPTNERCLSS